MIIPKLWAGTEIGYLMPFTEGERLGGEASTGKGMER